MIAALGGEEEEEEGGGGGGGGGRGGNRDRDEDGRTRKQSGHFLR